MGPFGTWQRPAAGREIIQFADAEQLGPSDWRPSKLLRGRLGTEWAMATHQIGEPVLVLDPGALTRTASLDDAIRTLSSTSASVIHPAADQTSDLGTPQAREDAVGYQVGAAVGRGYEARIQTSTLPGRGFGRKWVKSLA